MAGSAVIFSPGFDDRPNVTTSCPGETVTSVMNAIGAAIKTGSQPVNRLAILTNHLGGRLNCSDYQAFRNSIWMSMFLFQSGHGGAAIADDAAVCPSLYQSESAIAQPPVPAAVRRSWQMPWTLTYQIAQPPLPTYTPALPSYNGEGPYDNLCLQTAACTTCPSGVGWCLPYDASARNNNYARYVDLRYHERQAAFESLFSGGYGFTYGAQEIGHWYFRGVTAPASYPISFAQAMAGPAAADMARVFNNYRTRAGLSSRREWIVNNGAGADPQRLSDGNFRTTLASDGSSLVLAYMPAMPTPGPVPTIQISTSSLPGLACGANGWTARWFHAQDNVVYSPPFACSGSNPVVVAAPPSTACPLPTYDAQACDWVLQIQRTGSASQASAAGPTLEVWADMSPSDGTSAIYAQLNEPESEATVVSPSGIAFQQSPRVARMGNGYLVVWHAEGLDGSLLGVFAQMLDQLGQPVGARIRVSSTTDRDQRDPSMDSSPQSTSIVVWSSHGQDGELGGIYGRLLDASGSPVSGEFRVNTTAAGHQEAPQVSYLSGGGFVVAWQTRAMEPDPGALSFRVFAASGTPTTDESRLAVSTTGEAPRLIDLTPTAVGGFLLRWRSGGANGVVESALQQERDSNGLAAGPVSSLQ
jgi:hypothetical protein